MICGVLPDLFGCAVINRTQEKKKAIKHAEASALFILEVKDLLGFGEAETTLIAYTMAAHTHNISPIQTLCTDGIEHMTVFSTCISLTKKAHHVDLAYTDGSTVLISMPQV